MMDKSATGAANGRGRSGGDGAPPKSRIGRVVTTLGLTATTAMVGCSESRSTFDQGGFVNQLQSAIATTNGQTTTLPATSTSPQAALNGQPAVGQPGQCYAQVSQPARYLTVTERVLVEASIEDLETAPATFKTVTERVLIEPARERQVVVPATYKTVTETVVVDPAAGGLQRVTVPAQFQTRTQQVVVRSQYKSWMTYDEYLNYYPDRNPGKIQGEPVTVNGQQLYLVEVPPRFANQAVNAPVFQNAAVRFTNQSALPTRTITRRVVDTPAITRTEIVPPVYATVTRRVVDKPATTRRVVKPARYKTVTRQVLERPAQTGWTTVACGAELGAPRAAATPSASALPAETVRTLQVELQRLGLYNGAIDGIYGPQTEEAVRQLQRSGDQASASRLRAIGVAI